MRALPKNPVFSLTVVGVLMLGIGLNAAVFTILRGIALTALAGVEGSSRLVSVFRETSSGRPLRLSYPDYRYLRDNERAFNGLMGSVVTTVGLGRDRASRSMWAEIVTGNYSAYEPMAFGDTPSRRISIEGYSPRRDEDLAFLSNTAGPGYFRTLKIEVVAGRAFESQDDEHAAPVA